MIFKKTNILIPKDIDMEKWSVVACDQYTSQPEYWERVKERVGGEPSTLNMIVPESYLEGENVSEIIKDVNLTMESYLEKKIFQKYEKAAIYVERTQNDGKVRRGIVMAVDLECYDYKKGSRSYIRATEGTVLERIPPRVKVRENAKLELPHIMLLIDDEKKQIIEKIGEKVNTLQKVYDTTLMENGGAIKGYLLDKEGFRTVETGLFDLINVTTYEAKYDEYSADPLLFAVGDGNHSLATAKACYENLKSKYGDEAKFMEGRYALVEIVNVHDDSLEFEPIHRVMFGIKPDDFLKEIGEFYTVSKDGEGHKITYVIGDKVDSIVVHKPKANLEVGTLQTFIDLYIDKKGAKVDYIHGDDVVMELCKNENTMGFLLPKMEKRDLFLTVIKDGALPRKTFSMGHAYDKRYYLECREI